MSGGNSGGTRKYGRNAKRSPAMARYRNEQRMDKNKRLAIARDKEAKQHAAKKKRKVPRGTGRLLRPVSQRKSKLAK